MSAATGLTSLLADRGADIDAIAAWIDRRDGHERLAALRGLGRDEQRSLYERAAAAAPLDLGFFVGETAARGEVVHDGVNTLPLPAPLRRFQKRFSRPERGGPRLFGYNEGPTRRVIGPGYFVAVGTTERAAGPTAAASSSTTSRSRTAPSPKAGHAWSTTTGASSASSTIAPATSCGESRPTYRSAPHGRASARSTTTSCSAAATPADPASSARFKQFAGAPNRRHGGRGAPRKRSTARASTAIHTTSE